MNARPIFRLAWVSVWLVFIGFIIGYNQGDVVVTAVHLALTLPLWVCVLWLEIRDARRAGKDAA